MDCPPPEERFYQNMLGLSHLIYDLVDSAYKKEYRIVKPSLVELATTILSSYPKRKLIENFISYSHEHWDEIRERKEKFFEEHAVSIFSDLPLNNVNAFRELFQLQDKNGEPVIKQEDRDAIWDFFQAFVKISIHYIHQNRQPTVVTDPDGNKVPVYTRKFFEEVDLERHANLWGVKRRFEC
jgi:hypothetical protein